jgi:beta-lactamase class A
LLPLLDICTNTLTIMKTTFKLFCCLLIVMACKSPSVNHHVQLQSQIDSFIKAHKAEVGLAVYGPEPDDTFFFNADRSFIMMSVVKFPQAVGIMHQATQHLLNLDSMVIFDSLFMKRETWSPFRDEHPHGDASMTLANCFKYSVSKSDNIVCDRLYDFFSIPDLNQFLHSQNYKKIHIGSTYKNLKTDSLIANNSSPRDMALLLKDFYNGKLCGKEQQQFLLDIMRQTETGPKRLKGLLPGVSIAHKTGTYFDNDTFIQAINDVGIVELKDKSYYIAVFVNNSKEGPDKTEAIIAQLNKMVYDYFSKKYPSK